MTGTPTHAPLVSIGMPVFNCAGTVARAIRSILAQTFEDWELGIVDDGSSDESFAIAASFADPRIVVRRAGRNQGLAVRLNECVRAARGEFFARMDADDVAYPRRLELQLELLRRNPAVDLAAGWVVIFKGDGAAFGARRGPVHHEAICARPWAGIPMAHPTWMGRTAWFAANPYRTDAIGMEDQDLLFRTWKRSRFAVVPAVVLGYREDSLALSKILRARAGMARTMARACLEPGRRAAGALGLMTLAAKSLLDTAAIGAGLKYRLLRHRAPELRAGDAELWRRVWMLTGQPERRKAEAGKTLEPGFGRAARPAARPSPIPDGAGGARLPQSARGARIRTASNAFDLKGRRT